MNTDTHGSAGTPGAGPCLAPDSSCRKQGRMKGSPDPEKPDRSGGRGAWLSAGLEGGIPRPSWQERRRPEAGGGVRKGGTSSQAASLHGRASLLTR